MRSAEISPGGSIPALGRLESAGYVRKGAGGARNRQEYETTRKGLAFLEKSWREIFRASRDGGFGYGYQDCIASTANV